MAPMPFLAVVVWWDRPSQQKPPNFGIEGRHTVDSCMQLFRKRLYGASMQASKHHDRESTANSFAWKIGGVNGVGVPGVHGAIVAPPFASAIPSVPHAIQHL